MQLGVNVMTERAEIWVGFTGTRKGITKPQVNRVTQALYSLGTTWFVHGGAIGADRTVHYVAQDIGIKIRIRPAEVCKDTTKIIVVDEIMEVKPPLERNRDIVNDVQYMLACPFGFEEEQRSGTWATIRYARLIHKPLAIIWPDGTQNLEYWPGKLIPKGW